MGKNLTGTKLDSLLDRWVESYPLKERSGFHRDGAVDEATYWKERHRVLFVMTEPNSKGGKYDHYWGWDLRVVLGQEELAKEFNLNLGLWVLALLDGEKQYTRLNAYEAQQQIRRVAAMNLKKTGGDGTADLETLGTFAMRDRDFILEEVELLDPSLIITCSPKANRAFGWVSTGNRDYRAPADAPWTHAGRTVLPGNSPSLRPYQARPIFRRLVDRACRYSLGALGGDDPGTG